MSLPKPDDATTILTAKLSTLTALVERLRAQQAKSYELLEEIQAVLATEATPGQLAKRALDRFVMLWRERYQAVFVVNGAKDIAALKRVLRVVAPDDLDRRMVLYLRNEEPFVVQAHHSLAVFVATVNRYGMTRIAGRQPAAEWHCAHSPRCPHRTACEVVSARTTARA